MTGITVLLPAPALDVTYLIDGLTPGDIHRPTSVLRLAGGKGLNLARVAVQLGCPTRVVAPLGGHVGALVAELAAAEGIAVDVVPVTAMTRSCVTVATDAGELTEFYERAEPLDGDEASAWLDAARQAPPSTWTALSGSVGAGVDTAALCAGLTARAEAGGMIAVDTHGAALAAIVEHVPVHVLKVNRREAGELLETDAPALELARRLRARTGGAVVVTDGTAGAAAVDGDGRWRMLPPPPGRYAVGSGDAFFGALLAGLVAGAGLPGALAWAGAAGAGNAAQPGAGLLDRALFDSLVPTMTPLPA